MTWHKGKWIIKGNTAKWIVVVNDEDEGEEK